MLRLLCLWLCVFAGASQAADAEKLIISAPALILASRFDEAKTHDINAYLVSEKLDGVRAYWDGQRLWLRSGYLVAAPAWFTQNFPNRALDGELWMGRGRFDRLSGLLRQSAPDEKLWRQVRYMIFELPDQPHQADKPEPQGNVRSSTFSQRYASIKTLIAEAQVPWLQSVVQWRMKDAAALQQKFNAVVQAGGEGLMLHRADAAYETGRSKQLLKMTPWLDAEAKVIGHIEGKGKYRGMLGALRVEMPDGKTFKIGSGLTDAQRQHPPALGTMVTYRYRALTQNGLPRFPRFLRVREGL